MQKCINEVFNYLVEDAQWEKLNRHNNNWSGDLVFKDYHKLGNKQKGVAGEYFVENLMGQMGYKVIPPTDPGHDRIIDGYKTEIKFSLAVSKGNQIIDDKFIINHVAVGKDWERLIFCGINPQDSKSKRVQMYYFNKEDFADYISTGDRTIFKHQQSGSKVGNDDYICSSFDKFIDLPFVKEIDFW
tara:strand:+ start:75 stop:632 length:558 start_codon:yes stop_codon:yes gene_type:complete